MSALDMPHPHAAPNLGLSRPWWLGLASLALTIINILCIIVVGILILKLKEVTPEKIPQSFSTFWRHDVKIHRDYYQTLKRADSGADVLLREAREVLGVGKSKDSDLEGTFLQGVFEKVQEENDKINIKEWVPAKAAATPANAAPNRWDVAFMKVNSEGVAFPRLLNDQQPKKRRYTYTAPPSRGRF